MHLPTGKLWMWVRRSTATLSSGWSSWRGGEAWWRGRSTRDQYTYFSWRRSVDFSSPARPAKPVFFAFCRSLYYLFLRQGAPDSAAQSTRDRQLDCIRMQAFIYSTATRLFKGLVCQDSASAYTDKNSKEYHSIFSLLGSIYRRLYGHAHTVAVI